MNLLKQSAHNLNQKIKDLEEVKQYLFYKKVIEEDAEIQKLLAKIKQTQDQMQEALKQKQMSNYQNLKKELAQYRFIFEKHPLLQNYLQYKKDVEQILQEVISILTWE